MFYEKVSVRVGILGSLCSLVCFFCLLTSRERHSCLDMWLLLNREHPQEVSINVCIMFMTWSAL